jgi:PHD/YefM family antitoxin component YafN of YafNO toxin-antitoxin module
MFNSREAAMPNIKPVSDLRNYTEVLNDIRPGSPVFLTKNGCGRYVVVDIQEYEKNQAALKLKKAPGRYMQPGASYCCP